MKKIKKFEEFDWQAISNVLSSNPISTAIAGLESFLFLVGLFFKYVHLPREKRKRVMDEFNETRNRMCEIENKNGLIKIYLNKFSEKELLFEINTSTRVIKCVSQYESLRHEFKISKEEMEKLLKSFSKHTNAKSDMFEIFQEIKDVYYYDFEVRYINLNMTKFTIVLHRNGVSQVSNIEEFKSIIEEIIDRIEDQYKVKLSESPPQSLFGIGYSIFKDKNNNLVFNIKRGNSNNIAVSKIEGLKELPNEIELSFKK